MPFALRFEPTSPGPLAALYATVEAAVAQGAWDEFRDESRRVKDVIEVDEGIDPLGTLGGEKPYVEAVGRLVAGRPEVEAEKKKIAREMARHEANWTHRCRKCGSTDVERTNKPHPDRDFNMFTDPTSWLNTAGGD